MYKNIIDMHTHSALSFDGNHSCDELCECAIEKGAVGIAITDHCDIDGNDDYDALCKKQFAATADSKNKYADRLKVYQGLEIGQGIYRKEHVERILKTYDYDFILGSLHNLENKEDFYFLKYDEENVYPLLEDYFTDLLKLCEWGEFDCLAHLDYPLRYMTGRDGIDVDITRFYPVIDAIFESVIKNNKAIEMNTSGLFMPLERTLPDETIIKRYKEAGGKYITVGSDAHFKNKVCLGINEGYELAVKCGFEQVTVFEKREPVLINIE